MRSRCHQWNPKLRRQVALAGLCICVGMSLTLFVHPSGQAGKDLVHAVAGMLIGISLGLNLFAIRLARRCGDKQTNHQGI